MPTIILCKRANPVGGQGVIKLITQHVIVDLPLYFQTPVIT